jgi:acyl dehydratase
MTPVALHDMASLRARIGQEVVITDWLEITQARVDAFAAATDDHQWIHVDPARARAETPFGGTIAHGFLTLSLLSKFVNESLDFGPSRMGINYGLNRVRFTDPVPVGARLRCHLLLEAVDDLDGGVQMTWKVSVEREGQVKPCLVAQWLTRRYF